MSGELCLRNRQRTRQVNMRLLRWIIHHLLRESLALEDFDLTIQLVNARTMAQLNNEHLGHQGSTDVITLDYREFSPSPPSGARGRPLTGEIFICIDEALSQAKQFCSTWQSELTRYVVHGVLHLMGYDDLRPAARRRMKREENRLVRELSREFHLGKLHKGRWGAKR